MGWKPSDVRTQLQPQVSQPHRRWSCGASQNLYIAG